MYEWQKVVMRFLLGEIRVAGPSERIVQHNASFRNMLLRAESDRIEALISKEIEDANIAADTLGIARIDYRRIFEQTGLESVEHDVNHKWMLLPDGRNGWLRIGV